MDSEYSSHAINLYKNRRIKSCVCYICPTAFWSSKFAETLSTPVYTFSCMNVYVYAFVSVPSTIKSKLRERKDYACVGPHANAGNEACSTHIMSSNVWTSVGVS